MRIRTGAAWLLSICGALVACGGGSSEERRAPAIPPPASVDYSELRIPDSSTSQLRAPRADEELLLAMRNGVRLLAGADAQIGFFSDIAASAEVPAYSRTTQQVEGVDEADPVKYDGHHLFIVRNEPTAPTSQTLLPPLTRNTLSILRTDAASATAQQVARFDLEGEQSEPALIYMLENDTGRAETLAAVSHDVRLWFMPFVPTPNALGVGERDTARLQLLDVNDPYNVRQTWKLEMDGWIRTSRKIGDVLYLVTGFRPRLEGLTLPADSRERREQNEQLIRAAQTNELLPQYRINDGPEQPLVRPSDCVVASDLERTHAFAQLLVITAIDVRERRITDSTCLNTNVSGAYASQASLYIGGEGTRGPDATFTVLHKFDLANGAISYAATGAVDGRVGWANPSYYMDERAADLRILTSQWAGASLSQHRLSILRQTGPSLELLSTLPNDRRPAPIGKPGEMVQAVRFLAERAYVVTARMIDPFYVIDLTDPTDPFISGELEIPGFSTYLHPLNEWLVATVGQHTSEQGVLRGVKVELFDVSAPDAPRSVGVQVFGDSGSRSEAVTDPHAMAFLAAPGDAFRIALPIDVFETPNPNSAGAFSWTYSGLHLLEVQNASGGSPRLHFQGVIRTNEPSNGASAPPFITPKRGVLHDDSVFSVYGAEVSGRMWQDLARMPSVGLQL